MIIVGDVHLKSIEPFRDAQQKFLNYLNDNFENNILIFAGDVFNTTSPKWETYDNFRSFLRRRKKHVYILLGNHDYSVFKGSVISGFFEYDNVTIIDSEEIIEIENHKILFLPYQYNNIKKYEKLRNTCDLVITHITPKGCDFAGEGLDLQINTKRYIHGHTHIQTEFKDKYGVEHIVLGVPVPTRHLEDQDHRIIKFEKNVVEYIKLPIFLRHETIKYGEFPEYKNSILNITNAPSHKKCKEKYKEYFVRNVDVVKEVSDGDEYHTLSTLSDENRLESYFKYSKENGHEIPDDIKKSCFKYLKYASDYKEVI